MISRSHNDFKNENLINVKECFAILKLWIICKKKMNNIFKLLNVIIVLEEYSIVWTCEE